MHELKESNDNCLNWVEDALILMKALNLCRKFLRDTKYGIWVGEVIHPSFIQATDLTVKFVFKNEFADKAIGFVDFFKSYVGGYVGEGKFQIAKISIVTNTIVSVKFFNRGY